MMRGNRRTESTSRHFVRSQRPKRDVRLRLLRSSPVTLLLAVLLSAVVAHSVAAEPTIKSARSGPWSAAKTWQPERIPKAGDHVLISPGTEVQYDVARDDVIAMIHVAGVLRFSTTKSTRLAVGLLKVQPATTGESPTGVDDVTDGDRPQRPVEAALEIGTPENPIPPSVQAIVQLTYVPGMPADKTPALVCRPGGRVDLHGAPLQRTWVDLNGDASQGASTVAAVQALTGWRVGDEVIVTGGSKRDRYSEIQQLTERRKVTAIDGRRITLDHPLEREHSGTGKYRSEVANLSRSVVIRSAPAAKITGHTMYHRFSRGGISYTRFERLGKFNTLGRYPIHFHLVRDTMRGSSVIGAAIVESQNRWVTIHGTQYMVVRDCVGYQSKGHGYFLEDGTEVYNVLDRNLGVGADRGPRMRGLALPFDPNDGAAFWWANGRNTMIRNTATGNFRYGFRYDSQKRSNFDSNLSVRMPDGNRQVVDIRKLPVYRFDGNESHTEGLYSYAFAGTDGVGPDVRHPHVLQNLVAWETHYALRSQLPTMWVENVDVDRAAYGIYRPWFENHVYRNLRLAHVGAEPFNRGLDDRSNQHGKITVDGLTFEGRMYGRSMPLIQISDNNLSGSAESHFRRVKVVSSREPDDRKPLINRGGGPRPTPKTDQGVPVYVHDWFGKGRHAMVVSTAARDYPADGDRFRTEAGLTGDESRVAEVKDVEFPKLLERVDDQPPATIVTSPRPGARVIARGGKLVVRGTTTDDQATQTVVVNGVAARDVGVNFHQWEVTLDQVRPGPLSIVATAVDAAGNRELTPHQLKIEVVAE